MMSAAVTFQKRFPAETFRLYAVDNPELCVRVRLAVPVLKILIILPSVWIMPDGGATPVRLAAVVQFIRWNAEAERARLFVADEIFVVVGEWAKEPVVMGMIPSSVGDVANTAAPVPVSSDNAPASCAEVNEPNEAALPTEVT